METSAECGPRSADVGVPTSSARWGWAVRGPNRGPRCATLGGPAVWSRRRRLARGLAPDHKPARLAICFGEERAMQYQHREDFIIASETDAKRGKESNVAPWTG